MSTKTVSKRQFDPSVLRHGIEGPCASDVAVTVCVGESVGPAAAADSAGAAGPFSSAFSLSGPVLYHGVQCDKQPEGQTVKIDWLTVTFPSANLLRVQFLMTKFLGPFERQAHGRFSYKNSVRSASGAMLMWSEDLSYASLFLNGESCACVAAASWFQLVKDLDALGARAGRLDIAIDDHSRELIDLAEVDRAASRANFIGFRCVDPRKVLKRNGAEMEVAGHAVSFGKAGKHGSGKHVVFYDKSLESDGEINAIRCEARFYDKMAAALWVCLADKDSEEKFVQTLVKCAVGSIDFRDRGNGMGRHVERMQRLPFWQKVIDAMGAVRLRVDRARTSLERAAAWVRKGVAPTLGKLQVVVERAGLDFNAWLTDQVNLQGRIQRWRGRPELGRSFDLSALFGGPQLVACGAPDG